VSVRRALPPFGGSLRCASRPRANATQELANEAPRAAIDPYRARTPRSARNASRPAGRPTPRNRRALLLLPMLFGCMSWHGGTLPGAPDDATYLTLRDTSVHFVDDRQEDPNAPVVVLIHGFASSIGVWTGIRQTLHAAGFRVLALDLKGFGWTGRPAPDGEHDYSPAEQARIVRAFLDARSVHRASIVAHSYGSSVALQLALDIPERIERIALYDAWVYAEQLPTTFHWARAGGVGELIFAGFYSERPDDKIALAFHDPEIIPEALIDNVRDQLSRPGTQAAALAAVRSMRYDEVQTRYSEIAQPTLLLWGREDAVTTLEHGERLSNQLPDARLNVYPQCGHFPMIEAARPSTRDLLAFLSEAEAAPEVAPAAPAAAPVEAVDPAEVQIQQTEPAPPEDIVEAVR